MGAAEASRSRLSFSCLYFGVGVFYLRVYRRRGAICSLSSTLLKCECARAYKSLTLAFFMWEGMLHRREIP